MGTQLRVRSWKLAAPVTGTGYSRSVLRLWRPTSRPDSELAPWFIRFAHSLILLFSVIHLSIWEIFTADLLCANQVVCECPGLLSFYPPDEGIPLPSTFPASKLLVNGCLKTVGCTFIFSYDWGESSSLRSSNPVIVLGSLHILSHLTHKLKKPAEIK